MELAYRIAADLVVLIHALFVVFVVLGGLLALRRGWWAFIHLPAALWGFAIEVAGWVCPLTPLEQWLRLRGGLEPYSGGFIAHYLLPVLYPAGLTREVQWALAGVVLLVNAAVYGILVHRLWRRRHPRP